MGAARALGAVLCVVCIVIIALYVLFALSYRLSLGFLPSFLDFVKTSRNVPLMVWLPVTIGMWVVCGLGAWLGWIMATTKEVVPVVEEKKEEKKEEAEKKAKK